MATYEEAVAEVTAPGRRFELTTIDVDGRPTPAFLHAPPSLRELFGASRRFGDATFLVYEDERWSFDDVATEVDALAAALVDRFGVRPGDRVAIAMRNLPEWIVAFGAVTSIGAVSVSFNAWWVTEEIDFALRDAGVGVLVADPERVERARVPAAELGIPVIVARAGDDPPIDGVHRWQDVVRRGEPMPDVAVDAEDDATILYTSGTTGRPKGAVSTHRAVLQALLGFGCRAAVEAARTAPGPGGTPDEASHPRPPVFILIVPLFHVTGCVPVMLGCVASGLKLVIMHRWDPERALQLIEREQVTQFVGVPTQSWDLLECPAFDRYDTSSLEKIGGGGAPAPPKLVQRVEDSFRRGGPSIGYGMTETNAYGPQNVGPDYLAHPTSTGRGTPILSVEIRDPEGRPLRRGELGEIWFSGPHLIRGYWNNLGATSDTIVDGWLRTGDLGRMDDEGFVYIEDRAKDMILRGGENVYSAEVEAAIYEHPAVYEAAVYGVPHERLGEEVAATVCVREGMSLTVEDLRTHLSVHLAAFKIPTRVDVVADPLPRNASGKILKQTLRAPTGDAAGPGPT
jgi:long-chain acyl-CoA synthetase